MVGLFAVGCGVGGAVFGEEAGCLDRAVVATVAGETTGRKSLEASGAGNDRIVGRYRRV